jgi:RNA polymerase sigma-70 factor (ECF subfamily)
MTDDELMNKIALGQMKAFEELFNRHKSQVLGYLCRLLADKQKAEDVSQEIWMRVIKYSPHYEAKGQFKAWLMTMSRNAAFNASRSSRPEDLDDMAVQSAVDENLLAQTDHWLESQENLGRIKNCVDQLPDQQRQVFAIWLNEDLSYDELAKQLALSLSSVKSILFRARQNLEKCIGGSR